MIDSKLVPVEPTRWADLVNDLLHYFENPPHEFSAEQEQRLISRLHGELKNSAAPTSPAATEPVALPKFNCWAHPEIPDSWFEHPADAQLLDDIVGYENIKVGLEFVVSAGWQGVEAIYRVTKIPDDDSDDVEVVCISHPQENCIRNDAAAIIAAKEAKIVELKHANAEFNTRRTNLLVENDQLRAQLAAVTQERDSWETLFGEVALSLKCLPSCFIDDNGHVLRVAKEALEQLAAAQKDADRYNVLRDPDYQIHEDDICVSDSSFNTFFGEELDREVDQLKARKEAIDQATNDSSKEVNHDQ